MPFYLRGLLPKEWLPVKPHWPDREWEAFGGFDSTEVFDAIEGDDWIYIFGGASGEGAGCGGRGRVGGVGGCLPS